MKSKRSAASIAGSVLSHESYFPFGGGSVGQRRRIGGRQHRHVRFGECMKAQRGLRPGHVIQIGKDGNLGDPIVSISAWKQEVMYKWYAYRKHKGSKWAIGSRMGA